MGNLVFQATLGGQVNLVGPNTASTYNINVPTANGDLVTTGDTGTVTNTMCATSVYTAPGTIGSGTPNTGAFTTLTTTSTINGLTVGKGAGAVSTNTAVGASALAANTTGAVNTAVGSNSLKAVTTASYNTAMGSRTLQANTTGASNSALGESSLYSNSTGSYNVAIGDSALVSNTTASNNTAVGYQAGYNTTGGFNVLIGKSAGYTLGSGTDNVVVGTNAGYSLTTGSGNTFIGSSLSFGAGYYVTTGAKNSILGNYNGNQGGLDIRTASNYIVLSDGDGNPRIVNYDNSTFFGDAASSYSTNAILVPTYNGNARPGIRTYDTYSSAGTNNAWSIQRNGSQVGSVTTTLSATAYNTSSDYRLKNTIAPMTGALDKVSALKPVTYKWNADGSDGEGFIAHELAEVCPQAVAGEKDAVDENGNPVYQGIDTSFLVATLTAAIQELNAKVEAQAAEIATLKGN